MPCSAFQDIRYSEQVTGKRTRHEYEYDDDEYDGDGERDYEEDYDEDFYFDFDSEGHNEWTKQDLENWGLKYQRREDADSTQNRDEDSPPRKRLRI